MKSSTPAWWAIALAVSGLSPVTITTRRPIWRSRANRSLDARLEDVFELDHADDPVVLGDGQRRGAAGGDGVDGRLVAIGERAALVEDVLRDGVGRALADAGAAGQVEAAHAGLRGELDERRPFRRLAVDGRLLAGRGRGCSCPRASGRRSRPARPAGRRAARRAAEGDELRGPAVADGDRAGLVQQQACRCRRPARPPCRSWR